MVPGCTGEPWKAPAWYLSSAKAATNLPSRVAPIFTRTVAPEVGPEDLKTSSRDITILTIRFAFRAQRDAGRLEFPHRLPAEAAADLGGGHADLAHVEAEQPRAVGAHDEVA